MITEDYVSFETAKLLKEKGFEGECFHTYFDDEHHLIAAPTLQMAMKWLREKHNLTVDVFHCGKWMVSIKSISDDCLKADYSYSKLKPSDTYEESCEAAIKYCLENLI